INAAPPDLHEQICGPHHKRPRAENEDDDAAAGGADGDQQRVFMLNDPKGSTKASLLTGNPLVAAVPPIVVYTGPKKPTGGGEAEADAAMLKQPKKHAKKNDKTKTADPKATAAKTDKTEAAKSTKPAAPKTAQAKPQKPKAAPSAQ